MGETLKFFKSRLCYYENNLNTITDSTDEWNKIKVVEDVFTTGNKIQEGWADDDQVVYSVPAIQHNWHKLPTNYWRLYMTYNEMQCLIQNAEWIKPKNIKVTISHTIPIASFTLGSQNVPSLSFNNTVFSMIYDLEDTSMVHVTDFQVEKELEIFCSTYDGGRKDNNQRLMLPTNPILYKAWQITKQANQSYDDGDIKSNRTNDRVKLILNQGNIPVPFKSDDTKLQSYIGDFTGLGVSTQILKKAYYPDFLQDNEHVKLLYPGENVDVFTFECEDERNGIAINGTHPGENLLNKDDRLKLIQCVGTFSTCSDVPQRDDLFDFHTLFPQVRDFFTKDEDDALGTYPAGQYRKGKNDNVEYSRLWTNYNFGQNTGTILPAKLIKGVPILDNKGNIINHHFMAVINWELEMEYSPNVLIIPRPLQNYAFMDMLVKAYNTTSAQTENVPITNLLIPTKPRGQQYRKKSRAYRHKYYDLLRFTTDDKYENYNNLPKKRDYTNRNEFAPGQWQIVANNSQQYPSTNFNTYLT